jgi:hypothetical protein
MIGEQTTQRSATERKGVLSLRARFCDLRFFALLFLWVRNREAKPASNIEELPSEGWV